MKKYGFSFLLIVGRRQLKYSILNYMNSSQFKLTEEVTVEQIEYLFQGERTLDVSAKK